MKWTVYQLNQLAHKGLEFDETLELDELTKANTDIRRISPIRVKGKADIDSKQAAFDFTISGEMTLPCSRTLVDVIHPFTLTTKELFSFYGEEEELDDDDFHIAENDIVDLTPIIKEEILLEVPMQIFADSKEKPGAAPQKGQDWQVVSEEEHENRVDPRLADLKKLLNNDNES
ncbi:MULTISPECIES: YceD family protein [Bacillus]|uniref:DUF177 domain-containing protein n=2 Tax=Bacillus TaxID=1386 RepID=A0A0M4FI98_9BACI|nr:MULTISPECIES: DUF177 domain-containing protein [Bacillus]ALC80954.1 hypothetical protein AM592_04640 [Bacillus gobiensis]MBP1079903.1 uncharacterized protein [Bacillus capparidis]MED1095290.1 DUF177 domain-containing protein [Bacillus capparidis]